MLPERFKLLSSGRREELRNPPGYTAGIRIKEFDGGVIHVEGNDHGISFGIARMISMVLTDNPGYKLIYYSLPQKIPGYHYHKMSAFLIFSKGVEKDLKLSKRLLTKKRIEMLEEVRYYEIKEFDGGVIYLQWAAPGYGGDYSFMPPTEHVAKVISAVRTVHPGYELTYYSDLIAEGESYSATLIFEPKTNLP